MKKIRIFSIILIILILNITTGCFKRDNLEGIEIVTTVYPIEYVTNYLYGEHSIINSIYPDDTNTYTYELNEKQIKDFSKKKLFIYNRATKDKELAIKFLENNNKMLIIDATYGMDTLYGNSELWLDPSNLLMISQNIRNGLKEYITNTYLEKEIDKKYDELKVKLSELDAELKLTATNANRKTIVVNSDELKFLEKYGFEIISLDTTNNTVSEKTLSNVTQKINNGLVKHLILLQNTESSTAVNKIIESTNINTYTFNRLDIITDTDRDEKNDYFSIMNKNIELLRDELY